MTELDWSKFYVSKLKNCNFRDKLTFGQANVTFLKSLMEVKQSELDYLLN